MVERAAFGSKWPVAEFWKDKGKPHRMVADAYVEGIVEKALERKRAGKQGDGKPDGEQAQEQETFLSHLVQATDDAFSLDVRDVSDGFLVGLNRQRGHP
jgi:hypothetical protein